MCLNFRQVWSPQNRLLPATKESAPSPLQLTSSCTLLRILRDTADAEASLEPSVAVAAWTTPPSLLARPFDAFRLPFLSSRPPSSFTAKNSTEHEHAEYSGSLTTPWLILKANNTLSTEQCGEVSHTASSPSIVLQSIPTAKRCTGCRARCLRLGSVLYAPTWKFLFTRQTSVEAGESADHHTAAGGDEPSTAASLVKTDISGGDANTSATAADREALAVLFPALHHGLYYATPQEFAQHCLYSDDHLLWCENEPLISVEWESEEVNTAPLADRDKNTLQVPSGASKTAGSTKGVRAACGPTVRSSGISPSRKRRRSWIAHFRHALPRHEPLGTSCIPLSSTVSPALHATCNDSPFQCWTVAKSSLLGEPYGGYLLSRSSDDGNAKVTVLPSAPSLSPPPAFKVKYVDDTFAKWYSVLRVACRAERIATMKTLERATAADSEVPRQVREAAMELLVHRIVASLALWYSQHESDMHTSLLKNVETVAALMRDWWKSFVAEASGQFTKTTLLCGMLAEPSLAAFFLSNVFQRRSQSGNRSICPSQDGGREVTSPNGMTEQPLSLVIVPSLLSRLTVECAVAITRHQRGSGRVQLWWSTSKVLSGTEQQEARRESPSEANLRSTLAHAPHIGDEAAATSVPAKPGCCAPVRLSPEESRQRLEDYEACMDLVLQLLFEEQSALFTAAVEPTT
ncbi:hypothetical protein ABL78_7535 [Leptomonas seymouri]|uniref:Uncharacterized protein n=1 Tax=Leptomonas seymouri TaxID=5684 RepID=A0A0N0P3A3_LEPSE|nr:hypothetical protein ABL78_7535 [Leptomonas seymouri]|eukprot:KPI83427.1 hypothetical protein ABL78_7535 [Leptomonas seymouri]